MAATAPKTKTRAERAAEKAVLETRRRVVDEFGALDSKIAPLKNDIRRHEDLARLIRSWFVDVDRDRNVSAAGAVYEVTLGPCGLQTKIVDMDAIYKLVGHRAFLENAGFTMRALEACGLDETAVAAVTARERNGYRPIVLVRQQG